MSTNAAKRKDVQEVMDRLRALNILISKGNIGPQNLRYLLHENPALLTQLISHLESASADERSVWEHMINYTEGLYPSGADDTRDFWNSYTIGMELYPLAARIARARGEGYSLVHFARAIVNDMRLSFGSFPEGTDWIAVRSTMLLAEVISKRDSVTRTVIAYADNRARVDGLVRNWAIVEASLEVILERNDLSDTFLEVLIENTVLPLSVGAL